MWKPKKKKEERNGEGVFSEKDRDTLGTLHNRGHIHIPPRTIHILSLDDIDEWF